MKMRKILRGFLGVGLTAFLTVCILGVITKITERKESVMKTKAFLEDENGYDIIFLGTSHTINGVYPLELWDEFGFTSYNLANHSTPIATSYWVMMNSFDYNVPRLVVLDCHGWYEQEKLSEDVAYTHKALDCFPMSLSKARAIHDLTKDNDKLSALELAWDFSIYHNRWNQLDENDFHIDYNVEKGAERRIDVAVPVEYELIDESVLYNEETVAKEYVQKVVDECKKRDIDVLLTWIPYPPFRQEAQAQAHTMLDFAEQNGINAINFLNMDVVDYNVDLYDEDSHLNPSGAMKITEYLGTYISDRYDLKDHRGEQGYESWDIDYANYLDSKSGNIIYETNPDIYLMLLNDDDFDIKLDWNRKSCANNERCKNLIANLGVNILKVTENSACYITGENTARQVLYDAEYEEFDLEYDLCISVYLAKTGEKIDTAWVYYGEDGGITISHIYE